MTFDPSLPTDGVNVSPTHPLREAATLVVGVVILGIALAVSIGFIVDAVAPRIPAELEVKLFSDWFEREATEPEARVEALGELLDRMAVHWDDNVYAFQIQIWDESEPNALALPGGTIAVTSGLLDSVTSENELAFVLGHELGHFHNRDHLRGLGRGIGFSLAMLVIGIGGGGGAAELAAVAAQLTQRGFDRRQESAADEFGLQLVAAEYGHTAGASDLFDHLRPMDETSDLAGYLSTHPLHEERIDHLHAAARAAGWPLSGSRQSLAAALRSSPGDSGDSVE